MWGRGFTKCFALLVFGVWRGNILTPQHTAKLDHRGPNDQDSI